MAKMNVSERRMQMLKIYLGNIDKHKEKYCKFNDAWFDKYTDSIDFEQQLIQNIIKSIDHVTYIGNYRILSKFEKNLAIGVKELSTGCKTAINICSFPDKIFSVAECGDNALQTIFSCASGNIHMTAFVIPRQFHNQIEVNINNEKHMIQDNTQLESILYQYF